MDLVRLHARVQVEPDQFVHVHTVRPSGVASLPTVVLVHGTAGSGSGERRWRLRLAAALAKRGFQATAFDHRGCGYSDGEFQDATITARIHDLHAVLSSLEGADRDRIGIFGTSLGSAIAMLHEARYSTARTAVLYTLPCEMAKNYTDWFRAKLRGDAEYHEWLRTGRAYFEGVREFFTTAFLDDLKKHSVLRSIRGVDIPLLLLQSRGDQEVATAISCKCFKQAPNAGNRIELLDGAHSFESDESKEGRLVELITEWFGERLL